MWLVVIVKGGWQEIVVTRTIRRLLSFHWGTELRLMSVNRPKNISVADASSIAVTKKGMVKFVEPCVILLLRSSDARKIRHAKQPKVF